MQRAERLDAQVVAGGAVLERHADQQTGPGEAFQEGSDSEQAPGGREVSGHRGTPVRECRDAMAAATLAGAGILGDRSCDSLRLSFKRPRYQSIFDLSSSAS